MHKLIGHVHCALFAQGVAWQLRLCRALLLCPCMLSSFIRESLLRPEALSGVNLLPVPI